MSTAGRRVKAVHNSESGLTIPELLVSIAVTAVFTTLVMFFTFSYWRYAMLLNADLDTFTTRLNAGDYLREAIGTSAGLVIQNSLVDNNTNNPDPAIPSNLYWIPIHAVPGTKSVGAAGTTTPLIYIRRHSVNTAGNIIMNGTQPYEDEYVVYMNGTTKELLVRNLANPNAPGNRLTTTCPPASATPACPADNAIAKDLESVNLKYFARTGNTIDHTSVTDPATGAYIGPDFPVVDVAEITLNITKKPFLQKTNATKNSTVIRVALRNT